MPRVALTTFLLAVLVAPSATALPPSPSPRQQVPAGAPQSDEAKTKRAPAGIIRGSVTSAQTSVPLRRVLVVLTSRSGESRATSTNMQGKYEFRDLPAGSYSAKASKAGFPALEYGQRRAHEAGKSIDLGDGQLVEKVDIALPRGAAIAGRVCDELGEPVEHVRVAAMRSVVVDGHRELVPVGSPVRTNDLGQYRVYGLSPGTYYLGTPPPVADSVPRPSFGRAFAPTFYPGTSSFADAQSIVLDAGQERRDANLTLVTGRPVRISGTVTDVQGRPAAKSILLLRQPGFIVGGDSAAANGSFEIKNLGPGNYTLWAMSADDEEGLQGASQEIAVGTEDLDDIRIAFMPELRVSGRIRAEPPVPMPSVLRGIKLQATPLSLLASSTRISDNWTFRMTHVLAGPVRFDLRDLPPGWALRAVVYGGRDVTDTPIDIRQDLTGLEIVLTNQLTEIAGTVTDDDKAFADYTVVAFAENEALWDKSRFVVTARPDQNGRFSIRGLPPGGYLVVAVDDVTGGNAHDAEYLKELSSKATKITLGDGEMKVVVLRLARNRTWERGAANPPGTKDQERAPRTKNQEPRTKN